MPFTLVHSGKKAEDKLKRQTINKLNITQKKQTMQNIAKQNYPVLVASYDTRSGNEVGLFYNAPKPTWGRGKYKQLQHKKVDRHCDKLHKNKI